MEIYKTINRELSMKNQELRCNLKILKDDITQLNAQLMLEREETAKLRRIVILSVVKSFDEITKAVYNDRTLSMAQILNVGLERDSSPPVQTTPPSLQRKSNRSSIPCHRESTRLSDPLVHPIFSPTLRRKPLVPVPRHSSPMVQRSTQNNESRRSNISTRRSLHNSYSDESSEEDEDEDESSPSTPLPERLDASERRPNDVETPNDDDDSSSDTQEKPDSPEPCGELKLQTICEEHSHVSSNGSVSDVSEVDLTDENDQLPEESQASLIDMTEEDDDDDDDAAATASNTISDATLSNLLAAPCSTPYRDDQCSSSTSFATSFTNTIQFNSQNLQVRVKRMKPDLINKLTAAQEVNKENCKPKKAARSSTSKQAKLKRISQLNEARKKRRATESPPNESLANSRPEASTSKRANSSQPKERNYKRASESPPNESLGNSRPKRLAAQKVNLMEPSLRTKLRK